MADVVFSCLYFACGELRVKVTLNPNPEILTVETNFNIKPQREIIRKYIEPIAGVESVRVNDNFYRFNLDISTMFNAQEIAKECGLTLLKCINQDNQLRPQQTNAAYQSPTV